MQDVICKEYILRNTSTFSRDVHTLFKHARQELCWSLLFVISSSLMAPLCQSVARRPTGIPASFLPDTSATRRAFYCILRMIFCKRKQQLFLLANTIKPPYLPSLPPSPFRPRDCVRGKLRERSTCGGYLHFSLRIDSVGGMVRHRTHLAGTGYSEMKILRLCLRLRRLRRAHGGPTAMVYFLAEMTPPRKKHTPRDKMHG